MKRVILVLAFLFPALVAIVPSHAKEIKIGLNHAAVRRVKTYGEFGPDTPPDRRRGGEPKGGVAGMKITYVIQDDKTTPRGGERGRTSREPVR